MTAPLLDRRDLDFLLYDWLELDRLLECERFADHGRETIDATLELAYRLAEDEVLPHFKASDRTEPSLTPHGVRVLPEIKQALERIAEAGLFGATFDADLGGLQMPQTVYLAALGLLKSASIATASYMMLTVANARLIATFGTPAQIGTFAQPQIEGRTFGTMCLSEPQAGSSLGDIVTRAEPDGTSTLGPRYRLVGNKMWISGADQDVTENIIHLVLAKTPTADGRLAEGTGGVSLFIVPKILPDGQANDLAVAGINHKMGYRGLPNCLLNLGEGRSRPDGAPGAVGFLVGEVGSGLAQMFQMMNEARVGVGLGAAMLAHRGYQLSLAYARERLQGRRPQTRGGAPVAIIQHPDVKRMLLTQKAYAEGALALVLFCGKLIDDEKWAAEPLDRAEAGSVLGLLTPVAKTWPAEWGLAANDLAIQVHGGYGYTRDFDVEQVYRDNRLNPIHEGTTGIQALDLLGRKIIKDRGVALATLRARVARTAADAAALPDLAPLGAALEQAWDQIGESASALIRLNDPARALDNATAFQSAFGHAVVAWLWLDQAHRIRAGAKPNDPFLAGKVRACRYFFESELPKLTIWLAPVNAMSELASAMADDEF